MSSFFAIRPVSQDTGCQYEDIPWQTQLCSKKETHFFRICKDEEDIFQCIRDFRSKTACFHCKYGASLLFAKNRKRGVVRFY